MANTILLGTALVAVVGIATYAIYNICFHPLATIPGPRLWAAFQFPKAYTAARGRLPYKVLELHRTYGEVVRIGPSDLAFANPQAWPDIYGLQPGRRQNRKDPYSYPIHNYDETVGDIIFGRDVQHARLRRLLAPGFTNAAVKDLGSMIESYGSLLVDRLKKAVETQPVQDVSHWFEWTTFDVMGEFAFGESFKCLETTTSHLFVQILFDMIDLNSILGQLERYKLWTALQLVLPQSAFEKVREIDTLIAGLTNKRKDKGYIPGRADLFNYMLQNKDEQLTQKELEINALTLCFAGADTTATVMIFGCYLLCQKPEAMKRAQEEVRSAFQKDSEINATNVNELKYMLAVLMEVMRMFPPGPSGLARHITDEAGQMVAGHYLPYNTSCAVYQLAANRLEENFARANEFCPERWLDDTPSEFSRDRRDICQPFAVGPRNCIGKPIAYMEMRVLMAKMLYNFSFEMADPNEDWASTKKAYSAWNNSGLRLRLKPLEH